MNANSTIIHARNVVSQLSGTEKGLQFMGEIGMIRPGDAIKNMVSIQKNKLFKDLCLLSKISLPQY